MNLALTLEQAARSTFAAYCYAYGDRGMTPMMYDTDAAVQAVWKRFAEKASDSYNQMRESPVRDIAMNLRSATLTSPPEALVRKWEDLERAEQLAWEAATWHIAWLMDNMDDLTAEKVLDMERHWRRWADKRTIKLGVR